MLPLRERGTATKACVCAFERASVCVCVCLLCCVVFCRVRVYHVALFDAGPGQPSLGRAAEAEASISAHPAALP